MGGLSLPPSPLRVLISDSLSPLPPLPLPREAFSSAPASVPLSSPSQPLTLLSGRSPPSTASSSDLLLATGLPPLPSLPAAAPAPRTLPPLCRWPLLLSLYCRPTASATQPRQRRSADSLSAPGSGSCRLLAAAPSLFHCRARTENVMRCARLCAAF